MTAADRQIRDHHRRAIERLAEAYRDDPRFRALIIGGSVAKGYARDDSDVDFLIIATEDEFERRRQARDLFINRRDLCDYDGGFVDGKIVDLAFLESVAERGNEPSRAAFEGAFTAFSHIPELDGLLERIPVYPEAGHAERVRAFYCMAFMQHWLFHEAERHGNRYAQTRATALFDQVREFRDWGVSDLEAYTWFMTDVEWSWMSGTTSIEDW